ncbi:MAG TPA: TonB-dependent receptor plug domain-containing protein, partial [Puia sp.]|nr:TonB-dependent receptor plug domain-containing protein [Puia sp.]
MKEKVLCCLLSGILCFGISAQSTDPVYSFTWKNAPVSKIFTDIENAARVHFSYNPRDVDVSRKITLKCNRMVLNDVISQLARQINVQYKIVGETIMVQTLKTSSPAAGGGGLPFLTGRIFDADHEPVQGAVITNSTRNKNVISDKSGIFALPAATDDVIRVQMLGYEPVSLIAPEEKTGLTIDLKQKATELDRVVVTALGIKREERALGYAFSEVDGRELKKARETNVINSLAGKVPGLVITGTAGGPAGSSRVIIRGNTTITGNNQPLYVVDGVPIDNSNYGQVGSDKYSGGVDFGDAISGINPDDIDKISVLKGPSASALYGSRAANGVILITTKRGSTKKDLGIEFNSTVSMEKQLTHFSGYQYLYGQGANEKLVVDPAQAR